MISGAYCRNCTNPKPMRVIPKRLYKNRYHTFFESEHKDGWVLKCADCGHESQFYLRREDVLGLRSA